MSYKYLGRLRQVRPVGGRTFAQLVNVPELEGTQRCIFCAYYQDNRTPDDYEACVAKNKCGSESCLWVQLRNSMYQDWWKEQYFSPTIQNRQIKISYAPRYLQYVSADINGYECNSFCHYYPERVKAEQTVAECAGSHNCGKNGSFFDLLSPAKYDFANLIDYNNLLSNFTQLVTMSGNVLDGQTVVGSQRQSNGLITLQLSSGAIYYVCSWLDGATNSGFLLCGATTQIRTWRFGVDYRQMNVDPDNVLMMCYWDDAISEYLVDAGMPRGLVTMPMYHFVDIIYVNNTHKYFTSYYEYFEFELISSTYVLVLTELESGNKYIMTSAKRQGYFLGAPYDISDYSLVRWVKNPLATGTPYPTLDISGYPNVYTRWLQEVGVRASLLY